MGLLWLYIYMYRSSIDLNNTPFYTGLTCVSKTPAQKRPSSQSLRLHNIHHYRRWIHNIELHFKLPDTHCSWNRGPHLRENPNRPHQSQQQRGIRLHSTRWQTPESPRSRDDLWLVHYHHSHLRFHLPHQPWNCSNPQFHGHQGTNNQDHPSPRLKYQCFPTAPQCGKIPA